MADKYVLDGYDMVHTTLAREWVVTINTPTVGVSAVLKALEENFSIVQGSYDYCSFVRENGYQRFRVLEG